jgi:hypothetical protein
MGTETDVCCSTCFALPGEMCRSKYIVHGHEEVTAVICATHSDRLIDSRRGSLHQSIARKLLAVALMSLGSR